jgi:hypothetical protein
MPYLPASLNNPGLLLATCLIIGLVLMVNATLLSLLRRGGPRKGDGNWLRALGGAGRERERQQNDQLAELHRAVSRLSSETSRTDLPHE